MHLTPLEASPGLVGEPPCRKPAGSAPKPSKQAESREAEAMAAELAPEQREETKPKRLRVVDD